MTDPLKTRLRERLIRVMCEYDRGPVTNMNRCKVCREAEYDGDEYKPLGDGCLAKDYGGKADALLAEIAAYLEEPTEEMLEASRRSLKVHIDALPDDKRFPGSPDCWLKPRAKAIIRWKAMLKVALK